MFIPKEGQYELETKLHYVVCKYHEMIKERLNWPQILIELFKACNDEIRIQAFNDPLSTSVLVGNKEPHF